MTERRISIDVKAIFSGEPHPSNPGITAETGPVAMHDAIEHDIGAILFGYIRYLPAPHGEGHGTLEHRPVEHIGLLPRID